MPMILSLLLKPSSTEAGERVAYSELMLSILTIADSEPELIDFYLPQLLQVHLLESMNRYAISIYKVDLLQQTILVIAQKYPSLALKISWLLTATTTDYIDKKINQIQYAACMCLLLQLEMVINNGSISCIADVSSCHTLSQALRPSIHQKQELGLELSGLALIRRRLQEVYDDEKKKRSIRSGVLFPPSTVSSPSPSATVTDKMMSKEVVNEEVEAIEATTSIVHDVPMKTSASISTAYTSSGASSRGSTSLESQQLVADDTGSKIDSSPRSHSSTADSPIREKSETMALVDPSTCAPADTAANSLASFSYPASCVDLFYQLGVGGEPQTGGSMHRGSVASDTEDAMTHRSSGSNVYSDTMPNKVQDLHKSYNKQLDFVDRLTSFVDSLRYVARPDRTEHLQKELARYNQQPEELLGWDPCANAGEPGYRIVRILVEDCRVFRTKARAPSLIVCEVIRQDLDHSEYMQRWREQQRLSANSRLTHALNSASSLSPLRHSKMSPLLSSQPPRLLPASPEAPLRHPSPLRATLSQDKSLSPSGSPRNSGQFHPVGAERKDAEELGPALLNTLSLSSDAYDNSMKRRHSVQVVLTKEELGLGDVSGLVDVHISKAIADIQKAQSLATSPISPAERGVEADMGRNSIDSDLPDSAASSEKADSPYSLKRVDSLVEEGHAPVGLESVSSPYTPFTSLISDVGSSKATSPITARASPRHDEVHSASPVVTPTTEAKPATQAFVAPTAVIRTQSAPSAPLDHLTNRSAPAAPVSTFGRILKSISFLEPPPPPPPSPGGALASARLPPPSPSASSSRPPSSEVVRSNKSSHSAQKAPSGDGMEAIDAIYDIGERLFSAPVKMIGASRKKMSSSSSVASVDSVASSSARSSSSSVGSMDGEKLLRSIRSNMQQNSAAGRSLHREDQTPKRASLATMGFFGSTSTPSLGNNSVNSYKPPKSQSTNSKDSTTPSLFAPPTGASTSAKTSTDHTHDPSSAVSDRLMSSPERRASFSPAPKPMYAVPRRKQNTSLLPVNRKSTNMLNMLMPPSSGFAYPGGSEHSGSSQGSPSRRSYDNLNAFATAAMRRSTSHDNMQTISKTSGRTLGGGGGNSNSSIRHNTSFANSSDDLSQHSLTDPLDYPSSTHRGGGGGNAEEDDYFLQASSEVLSSALKLLNQGLIDQAEYNQLVNSDTKFRKETEREKVEQTYAKVETAFGELWEAKRQRVLGDRYDECMNTIGTGSATGNGSAGGGNAGGSSGEGEGGEGGDGKGDKFWPG